MKTGNGTLGGLGSDDLPVNDCYERGADVETMATGKFRQIKHYNRRQRTVAKRESVVRNVLHELTLNYCLGFLCRSFLASLLPPGSLLKG